MEKPKLLTAPIDIVGQPVSAKTVVKAVATQEKQAKEFAFIKKTQRKKATMSRIGLSSGVITLAFLASSSIPANAASIDEVQGLEPALTTQTLIIPTQTITVPATVQSANVERDGYSATSQAELDAIKAAEEAAAVAEAARIQAEQQAAAVAAAQAANGTRTANGSAPFRGAVPNQVTSSDGIIAEAQKWVGIIPYTTGNTPATGFMCDGYVQWVYGQNGVSLPRGVDSQRRMGVDIPRSEAKAGDLVVWPGQHVAIYDGNGGYYHSPTYGRYVEHSTTIAWGNPVFVRIAH